MYVWIRIAARYFIGALGGLLVYWNVPEEYIKLIKNDPELFTGVTLLLAGVVEYITIFARKKGWLT